MINQENLIKIINFRKKMHEHPEVSNHEDNTRKLIKEFVSINMPNYQLHDEIKWLYYTKDFKENRRSI